MNTYKLVAKTEDSMVHLTVTFDDEGVIKQETHHTSEVFKEYPNIITDLYTLSLWAKSNKTLDEFIELYLNQYKGMYLKPVRISKNENGAIEGSGYYIHTNAAGVLVNYKKGKFKEFSNLYLALDWICDVHYPAQQKKIIDEVIL